jgi:hypothetical protein
MKNTESREHIEKSRELRAVTVEREQRKIGEREYYQSGEMAERVKRTESTGSKRTEVRKQKCKNQTYQRKI